MRSSWSAGSKRRFLFAWNRHRPTRVTDVAAYQEHLLAAEVTNPAAVQA